MKMIIFAMVVGCLGVAVALADPASVTSSPGSSISGSDPNGKSGSNNSNFGAGNAPGPDTTARNSGATGDKSADGAIIDNTPPGQRSARNNQPKRSKNSKTSGLNRGQ